jgi:hypothetical protein
MGFFIVDDTGLVITRLYHYHYLVTVFTIIKKGNCKSFLNAFRDSRIYEGEIVIKTWITGDRIQKSGNLMAKYPQKDE